MMLFIIGIVLLAVILGLILTFKYKPGLEGHGPDKAGIIIFLGYLAGLFILLGIVQWSLNTSHMFVAIGGLLMGLSLVKVSRIFAMDTSTLLTGTKPKELNKANVLAALLLITGFLTTVISAKSIEYTTPWAPGKATIVFLVSFLVGIIINYVRETKAK